MARLCRRPQLASRDAWPDLDWQVGEIEEKVEEYHALDYPVCSSLAAGDEYSSKEKENGKFSDEYCGYIGDLDAVRNLKQAGFRYTVGPAEEYIADLGPLY